jgi:hypothetical protein
LSMSQRRAVSRESAVRYRNANRPGKAKILDELCAVTGWHRDHARKALRTALVPRVRLPGVSSCRQGHRCPPGVIIAGPRARYWPAPAGRAWHTCMSMTSGRTAPATRAVNGSRASRRRQATGGQWVHLRGEQAFRTLSMRTADGCSTTTHSLKPEAV